MTARQQVAHVFRHEYGFLVASLLRRVGVEQLDAVEDVVQHAMLKALDVWTRDVIPDNPPAWLYQVAYRQFLTNTRNAKRRQELLAVYSASQGAGAGSKDHIDEAPATEEMGRDLLQMLMVACDESIPLESQLVFTLKTLCGFNTREVALRLFLSEANVYKRFSRAKQRLQQKNNIFEELSAEAIAIRLPMVQRVLYLLFTEGYLSSHEDNAIRIDLCEESVRLMRLLAENPYGDVPESHALLALMYFHCSRINARQDESGELLLLAQQDRSKWDRDYVEMAMTSLYRSASDDGLSRYHLEASIAAEHCLAKSLAATNWQNIIKAYEVLEKIAPSPLHILNRAVAVAEWQGAEAGLTVLSEANIPSWLEQSYHWHAVMADLQQRCGFMEAAETSASYAMKAAPTAHIRALLKKRLQLSH